MWFAVTIHMKDHPIVTIFTVRQSHQLIKTFVCMCISWQVFTSPIGIFAQIAAYHRVLHWQSESRGFLSDGTVLCLVQNSPCCIFCSFFIHAASGKVTSGWTCSVEYFHDLNVSLCHRNVRKKQNNIQRSLSKGPHISRNAFHFV